MPDNIALIWLQAANFNILLLEAILLRDVPIRGFEAKVYRYLQDISSTAFHSQTRILSLNLVCRQSGETFISREWKA